MQVTVKSLYIFSDIVEILTPSDLAIYEELYYDLLTLYPGHTIDIHKLSCNHRHITISYTGPLDQGLITRAKALIKIAGLTPTKQLTKITLPN